MNETQEEIWQYLIDNALGMDNAIPMADLAEEMGYEPYGSNNDNFRPIITAMVRDHGRPIGTCENGVFVITNQEELDAAVEYVTRRTKADALRENGIYQP
jgi:hypothetical protein